MYLSSQENPPHHQSRHSSNEGCAGGDDHVAELAGAHPRWKVTGLARGDDEGLAAGGLGNEVGEVECI